MAILFLNQIAQTMFVFVSWLYAPANQGSNGFEGLFSVFTLIIDNCSRIYSSINNISTTMGGPHYYP
jgi:hypothetical protein